MRNAVIFGGGGFIGSSFYKQFASEYEEIVIVDKFYGPSHSTLDEFKKFNEFLRPQDYLLTSDVTEIRNWPELLREANEIFILNADTGTGNSFLTPSKTIEENLGKLSVIIESIRLNSRKDSARIIFASSRAVYGEGHWVCEEHGYQLPDRSPMKLSAGMFAPECTKCKKHLVLKGSTENDPVEPLSVYGLSKAAGERLLSLTLSNSGFDVRIVRFQNVYGVGQAVDNPYTGVLNWFSKSLIKNQKVSIFEHGLIVRDFIFVSDAAILLNKIASAKRSVESLDKPLIINGGSGDPTLLATAAKLLRGFYGSSSNIESTDQYRTGDVLGAVADLTRSKYDLDFSPTISLQDGLSLYSNWFLNQQRAL